MKRTEIDLKKFPHDLASKEWLENESIVRGVVFIENMNIAATGWIGLKAITLDGNELWIVEETKVQSLEAKMGFKKPLQRYFKISTQQAEAILGNHA